MLKIALMLIICGSTAYSQSLSASRMPMSFGTVRKTVFERKPLRGNQEDIESADSVRYALMICPLCDQKMTEVYKDTVSMGGTRKAMRVLRCAGGNRVLLTYTIAPMGMVWYSRAAYLKSTGK